MQAQFLTDDSDAKTALNAKKSKKSKSKSKATTTNAAQGKTKKDAESILAGLKTDETNAKAKVTKTKAAMTKDKCATKADKDDADCKALEATLKTEEAAVTTATAAVTKQEAYIKKHFSSSGATVGIIVGSIVAVLCIGGGAAWYIKRKKAEESFDDVYTSFVDAEL